MCARECEWRSDCRCVNLHPFCAHMGWFVLFDDLACAAFLLVQHCGFHSSTVPPSSESAVSRFFFLSQCGASNGTETLGWGSRQKVDGSETGSRGALLAARSVPDALVGNLNHIVSHAYAQCRAHVMSRPDCSDDRSVSTSPDGADRGRSASGIGERRLVAQL